MTEEERRNRNPAPESRNTTIAEVETHPIVNASELELHRVYVVQSPKHIVTLNYMGAQISLHPATLEPVFTCHFHGPRANFDAYLMPLPDGSFSDAAGTRLIVRRWTGAADEWR